MIEDSYRILDSESFLKVDILFQLLILVLFLIWGSFINFKVNIFFH